MEYWNAGMMEGKTRSSQCTAILPGIASPRFLLSVGHRVPRLFPCRPDRPQKSHQGSRGTRCPSRIGLVLCRGLLGLELFPSPGARMLRLRGKGRTS